VTAEAGAVRILNVEDYAPTRYARSKVLRDAGFEVVEADSGETAFGLLPTVRPHLVVLDMHLPDFNGSEICRRIKAEPATSLVQVLHVTSSARGAEDYAKALDMGADGYLVEPVEPRVLVATVRALVRARRAEETVQKMASELLAAEQAARAAAEAANRAKDQFLAILSHELRTPMTAILGWVGMLATGRLDADTTARAMEVIGRNARLQVQIVDELLDVSRMISGKMSLTLGRVDVLRVLEASIDSVRAAAGDKRIAIELRRSGATAWVSADPSRLQQIFINLLTNAIKFTPPGGRVDVALESGGDLVRVTVRDTGQGVDPEFLPHLFEPFRQAEGPGRRARMGLGLGLAIVRHLVELHGGKIAAESEGIGRGATFTVTLPADRTGSSRLAPVESDDTSPPATPLIGVRIVLVEDERDARDALTWMLADAGAEVFAVETVRAAIEAIRVHAPALVISDIGLPGEEDGYDLIRELRALGRERGGTTPAIALTAFARGTDNARALGEGYDLHLAKPIERDSLTAAIQELLGGALLRKLRGEPR
jgi:signal transduction histidine kinase